MLGDDNVVGVESSAATAYDQRWVASQSTLTRKSVPVSCGRLQDLLAKSSGFAGAAA